MGSKLVDILNALMDMGYRQMTIIGHRFRSVYIVHAIDGIEDDGPHYFAYEQDDGTVTVYRRDPETQALVFATTIMR